MNQGSDREQDMRPEYDIRGGVRGKYLERYNASGITQVTASTFKSDLVANATSTAESVGEITRPVSITRPMLYAYYSPSPKIKGGSAVTVDAG